MRVLLAILVLFAAIGAGADDCQEFAYRSAKIVANGVTRVVVVGGAGFLHIEGRAGTDEIRASGRACAAIEEVLVGIRLSTSRKGNEVTIQAAVPKQSASFFAAAPRLDLTIVVPARVDVVVGDTSGEVAITNVHSAGVAEKSGAIRITRVTRDVVIDVHNGPVTVSDVGGNFTVRPKGTGAVHYERVAGRVSMPR